MDNKAYLDQIAVKGKVKSGPIFTPMLIKIIAAGVVALITLIIVGAVISSSNSKVTQTYERAYLRITNLANAKGPLQVYAEKVKDSNLRSYALTFFSSLKTTNVSLSGISNNIGIKPNDISKTVKGEEDANTADLEASFNNAVLTGTIDEVYASKFYQQISLLLAIEAEARAKTTNQQFASVLDQSTNDIVIIQNQLNEFNSGK
ncbi:hypothetical protein IKG13_01385 [Candidatus Saccharibacteria bacterium]|nr:hypothetical protein [Candidatus Saccharibacteria bacterium]MBR3322694.1 hypothetical protein [Candidatus Saccharibacteria bacterium]